MATTTTKGFDDDKTSGETVTGDIIDPTRLLDNVRKQDPEAAVQRISSRMLGTNSLDELFSATKGITSDELDGKSIEVTGVEWSEYESQRGPIPLAVVQATDLMTGESFEFATTATMLVTFLYQAQRLSAIPFRARIAAKQTRGGNTALNFERI